MTIIINFNSNKELDIALIPSDIYNETINNKTIKIQDYFIKNPLILFSFVGFNSKLKLANQLSSNKKCGCFYNIPWKTRYQELNKTSQMTITFSQQVEEYRYMISLEYSYMQYLSQIALTMIMDIKQFLYYRTNNLETCIIFNKKYYKDNFKNNKQFLYYVTTYFSKI
jgi:hypothetical protein